MDQILRPFRGTRRRAASTIGRQPGSSEILVTSCSKSRVMRRLPLRYRYITSHINRRCLLVPPFLND